MSILDGAYWEQKMKPITNSDRVRSMRDEELAILLSGSVCPPGKEAEDSCCAAKNDCRHCWLG